MIHKREFVLGLLVFLGCLLNMTFFGTQVGWIAAVLGLLLCISGYLMSLFLRPTPIPGALGDLFVLGSGQRRIIGVSVWKEYYIFLIPSGDLDVEGISVPRAYLVHNEQVILPTLIPEDMPEMLGISNEGEVNLLFLHFDTIMRLTLPFTTTGIVIPCRSLGCPKESSGTSTTLRER